MKVVFLGVGGWISKPILGHLSILILPRTGKGILLDAGEATCRALYSHGFKVSDLEGIIISHLHGDHVIGLPTLIMLAKYFERSNEVNVYVAEEVLEDLFRVLKALGVDVNIVKLHPISSANKLSIGVFNLKFERTIHPVPTLSVRVEAEDKCVTYSGDTSYNPYLIELAKNCDLLIHESAGYVEGAHLYGHSTINDAILVASKAGVKRLALAHYYVDVPGLRTGVPGDLEVYLPYPGYEIEL
ncbi:MAG: MBL fold metallo-hydrolase [Desulfurococcaceae archaeon]